MINQKILFGDKLSLICIYFAAAVPYSDSLNPIALYGAIPLAFAWCFAKYNVIRENKYMKILTILYLWLCVCYIFAGDLNLANKELKRVLGSFLLCYVVAGLAKKDKLLPFLYIVFVILIASAWYYAKTNILTLIEFGQERLNDEKLNANTLAYYTLYLTFVVYFLGDMLRGVLRVVFRFSLFGIVFLTFYTAIYTGSRQVLLLQIPLLCLLFWYRYLRESYKGILILIFSLLAMISVYESVGKNIYENSFLKQRNEKKLKEDTRTKIAKDCFKHGFDHPIFGNGPGNSVRVISTHHFAHNTFLELLVNAGIPGVAIFTSLIGFFLILQFKRWRRYKDRWYMFFFVFGCFWLMDQMFYVFYVDLWLMSFFLLVSSHSELYFKQNKLAYVFKR